MYSIIVIYVQCIYKKKHEAICDFPSNYFYGGNLECAWNVPRQKQPSVLNIWPGGKLKPLVFCHMEGKVEALVASTAEGGMHSSSNRQEAIKVVGYFVFISILKAQSRFQVFLLYL